MVYCAGQLGPSSYMMILMMCKLTIIYKPAYRFRDLELRDEAGLFFLLFQLVAPCALNSVSITMS